ncbi:hypothetical protein PENANT_c007G06517 [Penicillium antarcticum]|uniref:Thioredoxin domain-containing protein n=1 Tax=Penicillium antarcticum TaxID=416450 RepID=A0A1V6QD41_9EURO|nr:uncharacterized protein N7508_003474 [Penicillium antarcticum]KAJ5312644.1 hypothetical protein N7508_003474 [Penicillium antarcticum]OQD86786.1 hypothetical protein PENANT_c007G06517 [Penicillium antarcticum]
MSSTEFSIDTSFLSDETLHEAYELEVQSKNGEPVRFGELVAGKGDSVTTVVIFVRHFFCIYDQDYVRDLAGQMTHTILETIPTHAKPAQVIIIGCGDHTLIGPYMEETSDVFPIYTDPSAKIYNQLKMKRTWTGFNEPPPYSLESFPSALYKDLKQRWKRGWAGLKGGFGDQQGGEWIFQGGKLKYAHRMEGASDHLTADRLLNILTVDQDQVQNK